MRVSTATAANKMCLVCEGARVILCPLTNGEDAEVGEVACPACHGLGERPANREDDD